MSVRVALARMVARLAHRGQVDKAGVAYWMHPGRVAARARVAAEAAGWPPREVAKVEQAAWLHDVLEDTAVPALVLRVLFGDEVLATVRLLTHPDGEPNATYWARIAEHPWARLVKLADVDDNSNPVRLAVLPAAVAARLRVKYAKAREALTRP